MNHDDHVALLRPGVHTPNGLWADLGSGRGAFTLALADLLSPSAEIYSIDRVGRSLREQRQFMQQAHPELTVHYIEVDFTELAELPALDGVVMANSLHYVKYEDQEPLLIWIRNQLKPDGRLLVVAYDTDEGNRWVPYPHSLARWVEVARRAGFNRIDLLGVRPSSFLGRFYATASWIEISPETGRG